MTSLGSMGEKLKIHKKGPTLEGGAKGGNWKQVKVNISVKTMVSVMLSRFAKYSV